MEEELEHEQVDETRVPAIASLIRRKFIEEKKILTGRSIIKIGHRHDRPHIWKAAALQCMRLKADPATYVRACFKYSKMTTGPFPNNIGGATAAACYKKLMETMSSSALGVKPIENENAAETMDRGDLEYQIKLARKAMYRINGSYDPIPINIDWICSWTSKVDSHVRVLLAYPDTRIRERCGEDALHIFTSCPNIYAAAKKLGYPIEDIIRWLMAR
jgi:hypothetical protein